MPLPIVFEQDIIIFRNPVRENIYQNEPMPRKEPQEKT